MPTVAVYVPASLYRELEQLAPANGYESADDYVRALSLDTIDELVTGVAMSREVHDRPRSRKTRALSERDAPGTVDERPGSESSRTQSRNPPQGTRSESTFKPDPKPTAAEKKRRR